MWTLGIYIAKRQHVATMLDEKGKKVFGNFSFTNTNEGLNLLLNRIKQIDISTNNLHRYGSWSLLDDSLPLSC